MLQMLDGMGVNAIYATCAADVKWHERKCY